MLENINYDFNPYNENQSAEIMGIVRSAMVCLHSVLEIKRNNENNELLAELFATANNKTREIPNNSLDEKIEERFIVDNLCEILFDPIFENVRNNLITKLHNNNQSDKANLFKERLDIARSLPTETKNAINNVISLLKSSKDHFLEWLFYTNLDSEHHTTQVAITELIFNYLPSIYLNPIEYVAPQEHMYFDKTLEKLKDDSLYKQLMLEPSNDEIIRFIQIINSGILVNSDSNYIWKLNADLDINFLELTELKKILKITLEYDGNDLSEKLSLLLESSMDPIVIDFKKYKLSKIKIEQLKNKYF